MELMNPNMLFTCENSTTRMMHDKGNWFRVVASESLNLDDSLRRIK